MKTTIITTTINIPHFLLGYKADTEKHGRTVDYVVVGDIKSHSATAAFCQTIPNCTYLDVEAQNRYMARFPALSEHLPWNSCERRNVGMLWAWEHSADVFIMLDDDNYAIGQDTIGKHQIVGNSPRLPTYHSDWHWFNVCSLLQEKNNVEFYHRGFPPRHRWPAYETTTVNEKTHRVVVNAGLWLENPDTDAITRLERPLDVIGFKSGTPGTFALEPRTWSPFNCQNTAIIRDAVPAYFLTPHIGRHADIWASYILTKIAHSRNEVVTFGDPMAVHKRSYHDLWADVDLERKGIRLTDEFVGILGNIDTHGDTYHRAYQRLIYGLRDKWVLGNRDRQLILDGMQLWHEAFINLGAQ